MPGLRPYAGASHVLLLVPLLGACLPAKAAMAVGRPCPLYIMTVCAGVSHLDFIGGGRIGSKGKFTIWVAVALEFPGYSFDDGLQGGLAQFWGPSLWLVSFRRVLVSLLGSGHCLLMNKNFAVTETCLRLLLAACLKQGHVARA